MDELYQQIIDTYMETGSVKKTAESLNSYPIKVRRVLITEGLWHSKTSDQIAELSKQGLNVAEIAKKLIISEKNVQSYMPYSRGQYGGESRSNEAIRSEGYRDRMKKAAQNQVTKTEAKSKKQTDGIQAQKKKLEELRTERELLLNEKKELWKEMKRIPMAMELHLELDMKYVDEREIEILKNYGRMEKSISRDFIVPGNMTLHALHYAIQKAFGWENSHLHSFVPTEEEFDKMTDGSKVSEWTRQVGMYFRFPSENYDDIYWDDDYEEDMSFKSWLKRKYSGPYEYGGMGEHYLMSQLEVERFRKNFPEIQNKSTDQRDWNVYMEGQCEEMIERPMLCTILNTPAEKTDWTKWKQEKEVSLKIVENERKATLQRFQTMQHKMDLIAEKWKKLISKKGEPNRGRLLPYFEQMEELDRAMRTLIVDNNPEPIPALSSLIYRYDYGDGWEVKITCTNAWFDCSTYARDEEGNMKSDRNGFVQEKALYVDAFGNEIIGDFLDKIKAIKKKEKPICTAWDGMNLVDDVGGIGGFCEFLETINGNNLEEKRSYKTWANSLGWTGRMSKPENILQLYEILVFLIITIFKKRCKEL